MISPYGAIINCEAVKAPVDGLNESFVDDVVAGLFPLLATLITG